MSIEWCSVNDDSLSLVDKSVSFLQNEFCPLGSEKMWSSDYFRWKIGHDNPAGPGFMSIALSQGDVVGTVSIVKKRLLIDGVLFIGGEIGDAYSLPKARRGKAIDISSIDSNPNSHLNKSIFCRLVSEVQQRSEYDGIKYIYGMPNKYSLSGFVKRLNYSTLKSPKYRIYSHYSPLLLEKKYSFIGKNTKFLLESARNKIIGMNNSINRMVYRGVEIENRAPSPESLNNLWNAVRMKRGVSLVRDYRYWKHRYSSHPISKYMFHSIYKGNLLEGVVVSSLKKTSLGMCSVFIVEWMLTDGISLSFCFSEVLNYYKEKKVDSFHVMCQESDISLQSSIVHQFIPRKHVDIILNNSDLDEVNFNLYFGSTDAV